MPTMSFKVTVDEARELRAEAKRNQMTLSEFIRTRALERGKGKQSIGLVKSSHTGASVFANSRGSKPLTIEKVNALLVDFP